MVITGYDSVFLYVQLVSILSDHIVQANFVQFDDDFTGGRPPPVLKIFRANSVFRAGASYSKVLNDKNISLL